MSESFSDKTAPFSGYRRMGLFTYINHFCLCVCDSAMVQLLIYLVMGLMPAKERQAPVIHPRI